MRRFIIAITLTFCCLMAAERACAQYYSWGTDPTTFRWRELRNEKYRIVYPDTAKHVASRVAYYLDAVQNDIDFGYRLPQMSIPFIVHPANMQSNGLVMWLPKRVEFLSAPAINGYSMPWLKQLVAHEYRHAVQYNNLNRGLIKTLSYIIGQQSSTIGLLFIPLWMMEGDSVMIETEMSTFGRGKQPSFSLTYRAYGDISTAFRNQDKWFCGSYKDYIPNHYHLGYFICRHGYNSYGRVMGDDMADLTTRRPWMVVSNSWVLRNLYGTSRPKLFNSTFKTLNDHWQSLPKVEQSTTPLPIPEPESHTKYSHPMAMDDGSILMLKEDLDTPSAFVVLNPHTGQEQFLLHTGYVSSRPALGADGRLWWSEYHRSSLFAQKVSSQLTYLDYGAKKPKVLRTKGYALYPTPTYGKEIVWVEYAIDGKYSIVTRYGQTETSRIAIARDKEIHDLAWDNKTRKLYMLVTDDDGMHIATLENNKLRAITRPAYTTLSNLRAKDGKLYFGSIASGRDELHCIDLDLGKEYQLSTSEYGSFYPAPYNSDSIVATSYDKRGYLPVLQKITRKTEVKYRPHPDDMLLPKGKSWNVVNLDTVRYDDSMAAEISQAKSGRRFNRLAHIVNIHSWAPASYDPYAITEDSDIAFNLGATIMSQNILSTAEGFLTWGWNPHEGSIFKGTVRYYGFGINLWAKGTYGGKQKLHKVWIFNPDTGEPEFPDEPQLGRYYSLSAGATLPILLQHGYHTSQFALTTSWSFTNGMVANVDRINFEGGKIQNFKTIGYSEGVHLLNIGASYSDQVRMSHRDFLPRWGVVAQINYAMNPIANYFSHLAVIYGKVYTPGFAKHHSLSVAASYQRLIGGFHSDLMLSDLVFKSTKLMPRGFSSYEINNRYYAKNYFASSVNYQLPIWYPDGGIPGVIYFKRLRLNIGGDFATYEQPKFSSTSGNVVVPRQRIWSYGGDLIFDFNVFGMPDAATLTATLSVYGKGARIPLNDNKPFISFGLGLPF